MPESYGARLRQQREERGITLAAISQQTRIKESLLDALEHDDLSQWPSGFYRRAFFRAYALAIGLNADAAMQRFLEVHPEPELDLVKAMASALQRVEGNSVAAGLRDKVGSAIGSLVRLRRNASDDPAPAPVAVPAQEPPQVQAPDAHPAPEVTRPLAANPASAPERPSVPKPPSAPEPRSAMTPRSEVVPRSAIAPRSTMAPPSEVAPRSEAPRVSNAEPTAHAHNAPAVQVQSVPVHSVPVATTLAAQEQAQTPPTPEPAVQPSVPPAEVDVFEVARLCTELGCADNAGTAEPLLADAARLLEASGLIVWLWDPGEAELYPALIYGYSERVIAQLPGVRPDADNPTAAAFRSAMPRVMPEGPHAPGALVVPLLTPAGCVGVLAIELRRGRRQQRSAMAVATIVAAQLAQMVAFAQRMDDLSRMPLAAAAQTL